LSLPPARQTQELNSGPYFQKYEIVVKVFNITAVWALVGQGGEVGNPLLKRNLSHAALAFEKTLCDD